MRDIGPHSADGSVIILNTDVAVVNVVVVVILIIVIVVSIVFIDDDNNIEGLIIAAASIVDLFNMCICVKIPYLYKLWSQRVKSKSSSLSSS